MQPESTNANQIDRDASSASLSRDTTNNFQYAKLVGTKLAKRKNLSSLDGSNMDQLLLLTNMRRQLCKRS